MRGLQFERLVLISDTKRVANQFTFPKRLNLVTGQDNSVGKSTLVKNLFWALGCEPKFDSEWESQDIKTILYFSVNGQYYIVIRYGKSMCLWHANGEVKKYSTITGDYSKDFSAIVNFDLLLPSREDSEVLVCPPPAYYFLPFYIDQTKSWTKPWDSFEKLTQFSTWKPTLVRYFTGYIKPEHFDLEEEICEQKLQQKEADARVDKFNSAIDVINDITSEEVHNIALSTEELEGIENEIEIELRQFSISQSYLFYSKTQIQSDIYDLEKQLELVTESAIELNEDYKFSVESVTSDNLECPLCGVLHDNSLLSRAGILADKAELENEAINIRSILDTKRKGLLILNNELEAVRCEIERINLKYIIQDKDELGSTEPFEKVLHSIANRNVTNTVIKSRESQELYSKQASDQQKTLKSEQRKLITKDEKTTLNELFVGNLSENLESLAAQGVSLEKVKAPTNYNHLIGGGAAENARGILAYNLAILRQIEYAEHCIIAPFVIDTPNQQEQADQRYKKIIEVITSNVPLSFQIILCAMENEALTLFSDDANIIRLNGSKLLQPEHYEELSNEYRALLILNP